jgi:hypothetical protein
MSEPGSRTAPWRDFLTNTDKVHDLFRQALRSMLRLSQGDGSGGLVDLSRAVGAMVRLRDTYRLDPVPDDGFEIGVSEFDGVKKLVGEWRRSGLSRITQVELEQVKRRANFVELALRGRSVSAHLERVDLAVKAISSQMHEVAPAKVTDWRRALIAAQTRITAGGDRTVENLILAFNDGDLAPPKSGAKLLGWLAEKPVRDLQEIWEAVGEGESLIALLLPAVRDAVSEGQGTQSLEDLKSVAQRLRDVLNRHSCVKEIH